MSALYIFFDYLSIILERLWLQTKTSSFELVKELGLKPGIRANHNPGYAVHAVS